MNAALAVVDEVGIEALTIRSVAKRVGAPAMTLYTHFETKEQLLDLMHFEVARRLYADHLTPTWQSEMLAVSQEMRRIVLAHPRWEPLFIRNVLPAPIPMRERVLALMIADGMTPERALTGLAAILLAALGLATMELKLFTPEGESVISKRFEATKNALDAALGSDSPSSHAAFTQKPRFEPAENFAFVVRLFITGLEANKG